MTKEREQLNNKTVDDSIVRPKDGTNNTNEIVTTKYNSHGMAVENVPDTAIAAISIKIGTNENYKIKTDRTGHFFNPLKVGRGYGLSGQDKLNGDAMFKYRPTNGLAFENYLNFLRTRHESFLNVAERNR